MADNHNIPFHPNDPFADRARTTQFQEPHIHRGQPSPQPSESSPYASSANLPHFPGSAVGLVDEEEFEEKTPLTGADGFEQGYYPPKYGRSLFMSHSNN